MYLEGKGCQGHSSVISFGGWHVVSADVCVCRNSPAIQHLLAVVILAVASEVSCPLGFGFGSVT